MDDASAKARSLLLTELRHAIDRVDAQLLDLLNKRAGLSQQVGRIKSKGFFPVRNAQREQDLLARLEAMNAGPLPNSDLCSIYKEILSSSRRLQAPFSTATQGLVIVAPPSKSLSHRALMCAALSPGSSHTHNVLASEDLDRTRECLTSLGATFQTIDQGFLVQGIPERHRGENVIDLFVGESGTTCRLITGLLAVLNGRFHVYGSGRMHERPMNALVKALSMLGVTFTFQGKEQAFPFEAHSSGTLPDHISVNASQSSQFVSALLLAAPCSGKEVTISLDGDTLVSWPYVAMTLQVMEDFGVSVDVQVKKDTLWQSVDWRILRAVCPASLRLVVPATPYDSPSPDKPYLVEGDWSNASYFLAAGAIGSSPVRVVGLRPDSVQGDRIILDTLAKMGASPVWDEYGCTVCPASLKGLDVNMASCPDLVPTVAVAACFASDPTRIRGVAHLRFKESNRLQALASQLRLAGQEIEELDDGLTIHPQPLQQQRLSFSSYNDHRIVMGLSLFGCAGVEPTFDNPHCVAKSFPDFWTLWDKVLAAQPALSRLT